MGEKCLEQLPSTPEKFEADLMPRLRLRISDVSFLKTRIRPSFMEAPKSIFLQILSH